MDHLDTYPLYNSIKQYHLRFLKHFDTYISLPELLRKCQLTTDNIMNCSFIWTNILEELGNCKNTEEYISKIQYLIYHFIICLTDSKIGKWQKYSNIINELDLVPIYPSTGHLKLMLSFFQKIEDKLEETPNYFENKKYRIYFAKNELFCDFNFHQLHYLQTIFELENFTISNYEEMYPIKKKENNYEDYQNLNNNIEIYDLSYNNNTTSSLEMKKYIITGLEKLIHKDYQSDRSDEQTIYCHQLQKIIYIIGSPYVKLDNKYLKFLSILNTKQLSFI